VDEEDSSQINKHVSLNLSVRSLGKSSTLAINEESNELSRNNKIVYKLGLGQSPFPVPEPVVDALKINANKKDYLQVEGLPDLRNAVADFHKNRDNVPIDPDCVLIGPGSKELMFLLQLVYYGEILIPTPCWVSYIPQATIIGRNVHLINTSFESNWHITSDQLANLCESQKDRFRPRILVLNYPTNPDGGTYSERELKEIAKVTKEYEVVVLSDEIYGPIHHDGDHVSIARFYPEGTIISSGLSKWCSAGGWRLGTFAFSPELKWLLKAMAIVASETYTSVSAPIQYAAVTAFRSHKEMEIYLSHTRRILKSLGNYCYHVMKDTGVQVHPPKGAFYLYLDFSPFIADLRNRGMRTSTQFASKLLKDTGVALLPGEAFGRSPDEITARIAYVNFDGTKALSESEKIPLNQSLPSDFVTTICSKTTRSMHEIAKWLHTGP
jgi:aspartate aminotransferase